MSLNENLRGPAPSLAVPSLEPLRRILFVGAVRNGVNVSLEGLLLIELLRVAFDTLLTEFRREAFILREFLRLAFFMADRMFIEPLRSIELLKFIEP